MSHFSSSNETFRQRYWLDKRFYKPGGPIFLVEAGESPGEESIPYLRNGIPQILANATGGSVIGLEHRYYGESIAHPSVRTISASLTMPKLS